MQLLESGDSTLEQQIRASKDLIPLATKLSTLASSDREADADGTSEDDGEQEDGGEGEIRQLAKTVLDLLDGQ